MRMLLALARQEFRGAAARRLLHGCLSSLLACLSLYATAASADFPAAQTAPAWTADHVIVNPAVHFDQSQPLTAMATMWKPPAPANRPRRAAESQPPEESGRASDAKDS